MRKVRAACHVIGERPTQATGTAKCGPLKLPDRSD